MDRLTDMTELLSQFELARPQWLLALLVLPVLAVIAWRSAWHAATWRRAAVAACRCAIAGLIVLALCGLTRRYASSQKLVVFVTDRSTSIGAEATGRADKFLEEAESAGAGHRMRFIDFAAEVGPARRRPSGAPAVDTDGTIAGEAVRHAATLADLRYVDQIVLLTDGACDPIDLLRAASNSTLPISTVPLAGQRPDAADRPNGVVRSGPRKVLLVADGDGGSLAKTLREGPFAVEVATPGDVPESHERLDRFDLVVLSNVSPGGVGAASWRALDRYVRETRGGLLVVGGERTFALDVFGDTPMERILPVAAARSTERQESRLAMLLVIDKSESMLEEGRLSLAKEAAKKTIGVLSATDKVGVLAFGSDTEWIVDVGPVANKRAVLAGIDKLDALGMTNMYPALHKAYLALLATPADRRHVILLTDGVSSPGDFLTLAGTMAESGITVSTVSVGQGADQTILKDIARVADGHHTHCDDPAKVPEIMVRETLTAVAEAGVQRFSPFVVRTLPGLSVAGSPPLSGYAATSPKRDVELLLVAGQGDPLLSWWRHGRGIAAALTVDVEGPDAAAWRRWGGYAAFLSRLAQHIARTDRAPTARLQTRRTGDRGLAVLDLTDRDAAFVDGAEPRLSTPSVPDGNRDGSKPQREQPMIQTAPGRYEAEFPVRKGATWTIEAEYSQDDGESAALHENVTFDDDEQSLPDAADDDALLRRVAELSGGQFSPEPADIFADDGRSVDRTEHLWTRLLIAAVCLLAVDVMLRRYDWVFGRE